MSIKPTTYFNFISEVMEGTGDWQNCEPEYLVPYNQDIRADIKVYFESEKTLPLCLFFIGLIGTLLGISLGASSELSWSYSGVLIGASILCSASSVYYYYTKHKKLMTKEEQNEVLTKIRDHILTSVAVYQGTGRKEHYSGIILGNIEKMQNQLGQRRGTQFDPAFIPAVPIQASYDPHLSL